eukprot:4344933-Prymnesium_polylepis.1
MTGGLRAPYTLCSGQIFYHPPRHHGLRRGTETWYHVLNGFTGTDALGAWPADVPIFYLPFEASVDVHTGLALATHAPESSPVRAAFVKFCAEMEGWCNEAGRASWDELTVLFAVRGAAGGFVVEPGRATVARPSGETFWQAAWQHERYGVWLSSEDGQQPAARCIDNDASTACCTQTQADPWISIQLPDNANVQHALVHACQEDDCRELLFPFNLYVANGWGDPANVGWSWRCATQARRRRPECRRLRRRRGLVRHRAAAWALAPPLPLGAAG